MNEKKTETSSHLSKPKYVVRKKGERSWSSTYFKEGKKLQVGSRCNLKKEALEKNTISLLAYILSYQNSTD